MNLNNSLTIVNLPSQLVVGKFNNTALDAFFFRLIDNNSENLLQKLFISVSVNVYLLFH